MGQNHSLGRIYVEAFHRNTETQLMYDKDSCLNTPYLILQPIGRLTVDRLNMDEYNFLACKNLTTGNRQMTLVVYIERQGSQHNPLGEKLLNGLKIKFGDQLKGEVLIMAHCMIDTNWQCINFTTNEIQYILRLILNR